MRNLNMNLKQLKYVCDEKSGGGRLFAGFERKQSSLKFVQQLYLGWPAAGQNQPGRNL